MSLKFDEATHRYTFNGVTVPNVTGVLGATLDQFSHVPADRLEYARQLGQAVHTATALYDIDDLVIESVPLTVMPYLEAWIEFRRTTGFKPDTVEERVFNARHFYAGTLDRTGELFGFDSLVDIKSGVLMPSVGPQTAAYLEAKNYRNSAKLSHRYVVQLNHDGTYKLEQLRDKEDFSVFLAALTLSQWRQKNDA